MKLKWITGGLGWMFAGPMGALLGYALGSLFSKANEQEKFQSHYQNMSQSAAQFEISLLILAAYVIKADGKVDKRELEYVRAQFNQMFGAQRAQESFKVFKHIINSKPVSLRQICLQIDKHVSHAQRLQLIHFLYGISMADGHIDAKEVEIIEKIGRYMYINAHDLGSIKAMFYKEPKQNYKILEIDSSASDAEVKKAFRKMAMKYHPDKLSDLSASQQKMGKQKFMKVQEAYEAIKNERGMS
ncbi:MAG: TerB family tellurite resistance protein [Flavobacteriales bacterium]|nr:TerB family tellurite resistance protein [Flavobacteriales bacterium]